MLDETQENIPAEEQPSQESEEFNLDEEASIEPVSTEGEVDTEALKAENEKLKELNSRLYARYKREQKKPEVVKANPVNSSLTREEAILYAKGHTEEEVELANKLAKINGTNPLKAMEDDIFKSKVAERLKKERAEKASLGASNNSTKFAPKDVGKMSEEEHAKLYYDLMSKA